MNPAVAAAARVRNAVDWWCALTFLDDSGGGPPAGLPSREFAPPDCGTAYRRRGERRDGKGYFPFSILTSAKSASLMRPTPGA